MNLPAMLGAAERMGAEFEYVMPVASTLDAEWVQQRISECAANVSVKLNEDARASLFYARGAVVASGTATVETALTGTPFVMIYRVGRMTWELGRRLVKLPHYGMVNLIAGRRVVPELIQDAFTPERVEAELRPLLAEGPRRRQMIDDLAEVRAKLCSATTAAGASEAQLSGTDPQSSARRAALAVLRVAESARHGRE